MYETNIVGNEYKNEYWANSGFGRLEVVAIYVGI